MVVGEPTKPSIWLWVSLKPSPRKTLNRASGDALGWLELPGPSTLAAAARGLKGCGVAQPVSRLPPLMGTFCFSGPLGFSWRLVDAVMNFPRYRCGVQALLIDGSGLA